MWILPPKPKWSVKTFFRSEYHADTTTPMDDELAESSVRQSALPSKESSVKPRKPKKTKRGKGRNKFKNNVLNSNNSNHNENGSKAESFLLMGSNANGLSTKQESLLHVINELNPSVITIQETFHNRKGRIKLEGYQIFEKIRDEKSRGGIHTAVKESLKPILVEDNDSEEIMTVQIEIMDKTRPEVSEADPQKTKR